MMALCTWPWEKTGYLNSIYRSSLISLVAIISILDIGFKNDTKKCSILKCTDLNGGVDMCVHPPRLHPCCIDAYAPSPHFITSIRTLFSEYAFKFWTILVKTWQGDLILEMNPVCPLLIKKSILILKTFPNIGAVEVDKDTEKPHEQIISAVPILGCGCIFILIVHSGYTNTVGILHTSN